jgi:galactokinase
VPTTPPEPTFLDPGEPAGVARRLAAAFASRHGAPPEAVASAPGRVNLIGEHVDYNGGRCLPLALPHATYAAVHRRDDDVVTVSSAQRDDDWSGDLATLGPGAVHGWAAYAAGTVWAMRQRGVHLQGLDVMVDGRVPLGAGLSSSAALECSVALAVSTAVGIVDTPEHRRALLGDCMRAEAEVAGAPTGGMDQAVSLLATPGHALLLDCAAWATEQVPWRPETAGLRLLVVDTRVRHALGDGRYGDRRGACEAAARTLGVTTLADVVDHAAALDRLAGDPVVMRRARHVFTEMDRVTTAVGALTAGDHTAFGAALTASHASLRDDFEVSCRELDAAVETSLDAGALGARMTGGGFGGSAIALVRADDEQAVTASVTAAFTDQGWESPRFLRAAASAGARVVEAG